MTDEIVPGGRPSRRALRRRQLAAGGVLGALLLLVSGPATAGLLGLASTGLSFVATPLTPDLRELDRLPATTTVVDRNGAELARLDRGEHREPVALRHLPDHVVRAVLAAEDASFFDHDGIDAASLGRAVLRTAGGETQGGSTITQQLAKLNYVGSDRTVFRKMREALYAVRLEHELSKEDLLERYLNQVYFGEGAHGIATAAATYFGVAPDDLTVAQAATLAGKIRAPEALDPERDAEAVLDRRNQVLDLMAANGWLEGDELAAARAEPLGVRPEPADDHQGHLAPHFVEYVKREALGLSALGSTLEARRKQLFTGGLTIETTLDLEAFRAAEQAARSRVGDPGAGGDAAAVPAAGIAAVVPGDGAIRVLMGGVRFDEQQFDTASQAQRQPGSAFKPFVYLAAVGAGIHPASRLDGASPRTFEHGGQRFTVRNYANHSYGELTIDQALTRSVNTVFMELGLEVGPERVVKTARQAGIARDIDAVPAVSLGGINPGVSPLEMATAYATFAAAGVRAEPYAIATIRDRDGRVIYQRRPETRRVLSKEEAGVLNAALRDVVRWGTGRAAAIGRDVAGKTGTTTDNRDAWFVGYVPQLATAVWTGHLDNRPMAGVTGGSVPAALFRDVMVTALAGVPEERLPVASPDQLSLRPIATEAPTTTTLVDETTTTTAPSTTTTTEPEPSTTETEPEPTTTTTEPPPTTTTTEASTTTTQQESTSTSSTSSGDSTTSSSTTDSTTSSSSTS